MVERLLVGAAEEPHAYWATWVFLAVLAGLTAFMLWLWSGNVKRWRALFPAPRPPGWDTMAQFGTEHLTSAGLELGLNYRSVADPHSLWSLSWDQPAVLVAQRRPEFPSPPPSMRTTQGTLNRDVYGGVCVLLTNVTDVMAREVLHKANRWQHQPDGADRVVDLLIKAGANPTPPAQDLLASDAVRAWQASVLRAGEPIDPATARHFHARRMRTSAGSEGT